MHELHVGDMYFHSFEDWNGLSTPSKERTDICSKLHVQSDTPDHFRSALGR